VRLPRWPDCLANAYTQDEVHGALVSKFFRDPSTGGKATAQYPELAWIHDIACKRYGDAAEALLVVNGDRADRSQKQVRATLQAYI
jgi:nuclear pore complex protein Nup133